MPLCGRWLAMLFGVLGAVLFATSAFAQFISVGPGSLPDGSAGTAYNQQIRAIDNDGPDDFDTTSVDPDDMYSYAVTAGVLPPGVTLGGGLTAAGVALSGTPTTAGTYNFTITATIGDNSLAPGSTSYTVTIFLGINPATLPNGTQGLVYNQTVSAFGGTAPYTYSISAGALPAGLSLNPSTGAITGIPTASGPANFTVQAADAGGNTGTRAYAINIGTQSLTVNPPTLPAGTVGLAYNQTVSAAGGTGNYTYSVSAGSLPAGLSLNSATGAISGTPTTTGQSIFTIQALDTAGNAGSQSYALNIGAAGALAVSPATLPNGTQGTAYSQTVTASGGSGTYTYSVTAGSLPAGLALNPSTGVISGTPTGSGVSNFTIGAADTGGNFGSRAYSVNIGTNSLAINPATLPNGTQNVAYSQTVTASGGTGPYTYSISAGALPAGLSLNSSTGTISGTPTGSGASNFTVRALDSLGNTGSRAYGINIGTASLAINPATLPATIVGRAYSQTIVASGGTAPYTYTISAGSLPPGLALNSGTGVISGTPTVTGSFSFTVRALDNRGNIGARAYTLSSRTDPALDAEVQGLIMSQVAATQRFASAQIGNVAQHLDRLHGDFNACSLDFGIAPPQEQISPYAPTAQQPYGVAGQIYPGQPLDQRRPDPQQCAAEWATSLAFWTAGAVQFGKMTSAGLTDTNKINTAGLTAGVDARLHEHLIAGAALGYGADRTDVGSNGTRSNGTTFSGTLYASFRPFDPVFIDASVGLGKLGFDNRRYVTGEGTMVSGSRGGSYWSAAVSATFEMRADELKVAPYVRGEYMSASLDGYSESGPSAETLTFQKTSFNATSAAIGLRGSIDIPMQSGVLTPNVRLEYKQTVQSAYEQSMFYTDLGSGTASTFSQNPGTFGSTTGAIGLRMRTPGGLTTDVEYAVTAGTGSLLMQTIRAMLRLAF